MTYRLEDVSSDVRLGESQSLSVDVYHSSPVRSALLRTSFSLLPMPRLTNSDNPLCAQSLGNSHTEQPYGPSSEDHDVLTSLELSELGDRVDPHGERLDHGPIFQGTGVREGVDELVRELIVSAECS